MPSTSSLTSSSAPTRIEEGLQPRPARQPHDWLAAQFRNPRACRRDAVLDMHALPDALNQPIPEAIRRITDPDEIPAVMVVLTDVWQEDSPRSVSLAAQMRQDPDALSVYAAFIDGEPVSAAWRNTRPTARLSACGAVPLCLISQTGPVHRPAGGAGQGRPGAWTALPDGDASPMSRPIPERFGL